MSQIRIVRTTSHLGKPLVIVVTPIQPLGTGPNQVKSDSLERQEEKESTISQTSEIIADFKMKPKIRVIRIPLKEPCSTQESVATNKNRILTDKSSSSKKDTPKENSIPMWGPVSTIIEEGYNVSWEKSHQELSKKLWLPTQTDYVDTDLNFSNGSLENILSNSWFSVKKLEEKKQLKNSPKISWTSAITSWQNITGGNRPNSEEPEKTGKTLRVRKYQLRLSKSMKEKVKKGMEATRYLYNRSVQLLSENPEMKMELKPLRRLLVTDCKENILPERIRQEFRKIPYDVRDGALRDFIAALGIQKELVRSGKKKHFKMSYMSRHYRSIVINHKHFYDLPDKKLMTFPKSWKLELSCWEQFPDINHDTRLIKKGSRYFLMVPLDQEPPQKIKTGHVVGLDPGIRTFQTTYGTDGKSYSIGKDCISKIDRLSQVASKLREGIKRFGRRNKKVFKKVKKTKGLSRKARKIEESIKNKISDIHKNTCKFLCSQYDVVVLPEFKSQEMSEKRNEQGVWKRKIGRTTTREMIRWSHYNFRSLLIAKGTQTGTKIVIGTEEYTSRTCTNCLKIDSNLGSKKTFKCPNCSLLIDRDVNGARNILLKNWERAGLPYKPVCPITIKRYRAASGPVTQKVQTILEVSKLSV